MNLTILLAKVLGLFFLFVGATIVVRRRYFLAVFGAWPNQRLTRSIVSLLEFLAGLFLVIAHDVWSPPPAAIITIIGWLLLLEGGLYLLLPDAGVRRFIGAFNKESWYVAGGVLFMAIGAYLAAFGFGWI